jgi:hypothetical protein
MLRTAQVLPGQIGQKWPMRSKRGYGQWLGQQLGLYDPRLISEKSSDSAEFALASKRDLRSSVTVRSGLPLISPPLPLEGLPHQLPKPVRKLTPHPPKNGEKDSKTKQSVLHFRTEQGRDNEKERKAAKQDS